MSWPSPIAYRPHAHLTMSRNYSAFKV